MSIADFRMFIGKQLKNGSVILAVIFPVVLALGQFNLIPIDFMRALNMALIGGEVVLTLYKIGFDEFLKSKKKLKNLNDALDEGKFEKAEEILKDNIIHDGVKLGIKTTKEIINLVKPKQNKDENLPEHNLDEKLVEARAEAYSLIVEDAKAKELFPT